LTEAADRFAALDAWRQAHPRATWDEIEAAVEDQLGPLQAQVLGDTVLASDATDLDQARSRCPDCGSRLVRAGPQRRTLRSEGDRPITLERTYARCPQCGTGLFPPG
jgi:DNA-directed RNA polymerase subunit RPC12/RpoP